MNRTIFRGISTDMNKFVYGGYLKFLPYTPSPVRDANPPEKDYKHLIFTEGFSDWNLPRDISVYDIKPETLGQCTGLFVDGNYLFEGDKVSCERSYGTLHGVIKLGKYDEHYGFYIEWSDAECNKGILYWLDKGLKIEGNIHQ